MLRAYDIPEENWDELNLLYGNKKVAAKITTRRRSQEFQEWKSSQSIIERKYTTLDDGSSSGSTYLDQKEDFSDQAEFSDGRPSPHYKEALETGTLSGASAYQNMLDDYRKREETTPQDPAGNAEVQRNDKRATVIVRTGQQSFRDIVLQKYDFSCAITGCKITDVLEAAHIVDYSISKDNSVTNGICLRADLHTLFDRGYITINNDFTISVSENVSDPDYRKYQGQKLKLPRHQIDWPKQANINWKTHTGKDEQK